LSTGGQEWFTRDREPPVDQAVLALLHGGRRAGQVVQWRSSILGLDAVLLADESEVGSGLLELVDKHGELPVSPVSAAPRSGTRPDPSGETSPCGSWRCALRASRRGRVCGGSPHEHGPAGVNSSANPARRRGGVPSYRMRVPMIRLRPPARELAPAGVRPAFPTSERRRGLRWGLFTRVLRHARALTLVPARKPPSRVGRTTR
jgi:hypothetical protein